MIFSVGPYITASSFQFSRTHPYVSTLCDPMRERSNGSDLSMRSMSMRSKEVRVFGTPMIWPLPKIAFSLYLFIPHGLWGCNVECFYWRPHDKSRQGHSGHGNGQRYCLSMESPFYFILLSLMALLPNDIYT